jgi:hypothetical protein
MGAGAGAGANPFEGFSEIFANHMGGQGGGGMPPAPPADPTMTTPGMGGSPMTMFGRGLQQRGGPQPQPQPGGGGMDPALGAAGGIIPMLMAKGFGGFK